MMQRIYKKNLQRQISFYFIILTLVIVNTIGWLFYFRSEHYFDEELGHKLVGIAKSATGFTEADLLRFLQPGSEGGQFYTRLQSRLTALAASFNVQRICIIDTSYQLLVDSDTTTFIGATLPQLQSNRMELSIARSGQSNYSTLYRGYDGFLYKSGFAPLFDNRNNVAAIICVDASPSFLEVIDSIRISLLFINFFSFLIVLVLSYLLARTITRPVNQLVLAARRISKGDYQTPIQIKATNEIGFLGDIFNTMQENIHINNLHLKTLRQQAENEADRIKSYNELILENIATGILTIELTGTITVLNAEAARLLRIDGKYNIGSDVQSILGKGHPFRHAFNRLYKNPPQSDYFETELDFKDKIVPVSVLVSPLPDENGDIIGSNWLLTDLSVLRNLQTRIKESEWLANLGELSAAIAHEIRNPLNSISLYLGILQRRISQEPGSLESVEKIQREIDALNTIITDFLYFARPSELHKSQASIEEIFRNVLFLAQQEINQKNIYTDLDISPENLTCNADINQLKQALLNIVLNAVQAMENGGRLRLSANSTTTDKIRISITDNGCGMDDEITKKIFKPFFSTRNQGTGLGMSIVNNIIEAHGGTIVVKSKLGEGTRFIIELPN